MAVTRIMEMQAIVVGLLERFEFSIPLGTEIQITSAGMMVPGVKGKGEEGPQLPLRITPRSVVV